MPFHSATYLGDALGAVLEDLRGRRLIGDTNGGGGAGGGAGPVRRVRWL